MEWHMLNSMLAILARCGSKTKALHYCQDMAADYPRLRAEYMQYHEMLLDMEG
jgi:hypothetical protein